jgi:DNA-binding Lrp family transcriptional regulator
MEEKVIKRLNRLKEMGVIKDYAIGGAHAVAYYLEPVKTLDLDIFILIESEQDFYDLHSYLKKSGFKLKGAHVVIDNTPVHLLPGSMHPLINKAVRKAKRIRVKGIPTKVVSVEYLIALSLFSFRLKDKMVIPDLLGLADEEELEAIIDRYSDEEAPLDKRLQKILESI